MKFLPGAPRRRVPITQRVLRTCADHDMEPIKEIIAIVRQLREEDPKFVAMTLLKIAEFCYPKPNANDPNNEIVDIESGPSRESIEQLWNMKEIEKELEHESLPDSEGKARPAREIQK